MNPTSHRMSFSFCYCHFISTWKLKTLGRKANHLWCLKCGSVSLRVWLWHSSLCPLTSSCLSALCPWLQSRRVQGADRRRSWKSQSLQHSGQWKVGFQVHLKAALARLLFLTLLQLHRAPGEPLTWAFSDTHSLLSIVDGYCYTYWAITLSCSKLWKIPQ